MPYPMNHFILNYGLTRATLNFVKVIDIFLVRKEKPLLV